jgi:hypothetical protein
MSQVTVANGSTARIFTVPPGLCNVTFWNVSTGTAFVGTSNSVSASNGMQCHSIPTNFFTYVSSRGTDLWASNTSGSAATINYVIVTDQ